MAEADAGAFAEFEREMIRNRTRAEAPSRGRMPGRKSKTTAEQKKGIVEAVTSGRQTSAQNPGECLARKSLPKVILQPSSATETTMNRRQPLDATGEA